MNVVLNVVWSTIAAVARLMIRERFGTFRGGTSIGKSLSLRANSGVYSQLLGVLVFELPLDNLIRKCAFGVGAMRTPLSAIPVPGNTNG